MADTFDQDLKVRLIETGAYNNAWGAVLNAEGLALLAKAIAGTSSIVLSGTSYSLPALANGTSSISRSAILKFTGAPGGAVTATVPASVTSKLYLVDNDCGQDITVTYSASTDTVTVGDGERRLVYCDGANVWDLYALATDADTVGGISPVNLARLDVSQTNVFLSVNRHPWVTVTEGPTTTINAASGNHQKLTLTGNRTMAAPSNPGEGQKITLMVVQDGTGNRTLTWNSVFLFESGSTPSLASGAAGIDIFEMYYDAALVKWVVGHFGSITSGSGATYALTIGSNQVDYNLAARLGSLGGAVTVNLTIAQGVVLQASSPDSFALDCLSALPSGSTLNLISLGRVFGRGGDGGDGAGIFVTSDFGNAQSARNGKPGGVAIRGPGSGVSFNITNASGRISGGGGGGGGGGATGSSGGTDTANGGGGGAGAGSARGGRGGSAAQNGADYRAADGGGSSSAASTPEGSGGGGNEVVSGTADGGNGGDGGGWGAAGDAGTSPAGGTFDFAAGTGGTAGKAIELSGGAVTWISGSGNVDGSVS